MRTIRIEEGDIVIFLKRRPTSLVPMITVEDHSGPLGAITNLSIISDVDSFIPKIEIGVASNLTKG